MNGGAEPPWLQIHAGSFDIRRCLHSKLVSWPPIRYLRVHLLLEIILYANLAYELELGFEPVNMLFFGFENFFEKLPAYKISNGFGISNCLTQERDGNPFPASGRIQASLSHFRRCAACQVPASWAAPQETRFARSGCSACFISSMDSEYSCSPR